MNKLRECPQCGWNDYVPKEVKAARIKKSLHAAKLAGFKIGRPQSFDRSKAKKLQEKGMSLRQIAKILGVSHPSVYRSLK